MCERGLRVDGNRKIMCNSNGTWSQPGTCIEGLFSLTKKMKFYLGLIPIDHNCDKPNPVENGRFSETSMYWLSKTLLLQCDKGYQLEGADSITCDMDTLEWSTPGKCVKGKPSNFVFDIFLLIPPSTKKKIKVVALNL